MTTLNLQSENCETVMLQLADGSTGGQQWYTETQEFGELLLKNSHIVKLCHEPIEPGPSIQPFQLKVPPITSSGWPPQQTGENTTRSVK